MGGKNAEICLKKMFRKDQLLATVVSKAIRKPFESEMKVRSEIN